MLFSTFYFSGTGNTRWAAEQFGRIVTQSGHRAELYAIWDEKLTDAEILRILNDSDYVGFANPIYGADLPPITRSFIERIVSILKDNITISKPIYMINTYGIVNGFGPSAARKLFADTYLLVAAYVNLRMCMNISAPSLMAFSINKEKLQKRMKEAEKRLTLLTEHLVAGKSLISGKVLAFLVGGLIRNIFKDGIKNFSRSLSVDPKRCTRCLLCVKECPTRSISLQNLSFAPDCTACMRCYNICPTAAILIDGQYADPKKYHRYLGPSSLLSK